MDEASATEPADFGGRRLLEGEALVAAAPFPGTVLRLGGIYGPGRRSLIERARSGAAGGPAFTNRIHRDDAAGALAHLARLPAAAPCYVGVDSEPATEAEVLAWLARRLGAPAASAPPAPPPAPRRARGSKRCRNALPARLGVPLPLPQLPGGVRSAARRARRMTDLAATRRAFAERLAAERELRSERVVAAFAAVPREEFLVPGPWLMLPDEAGYRSTPDADPRRLYEDVAVAIDASRVLNNGAPGFLARVFDTLATEGGRDGRAHRLRGRLLQRDPRRDRRAARPRARGGARPRAVRAGAPQPAPLAPGRGAPRRRHEGAAGAGGRGVGARRRDASAAALARRDRAGRAARHAADRDAAAVADPAARARPRRPHPLRRAAARRLRGALRRHLRHDGPARWPRRGAPGAAAPGLRSAAAPPRCARCAPSRTPRTRAAGCIGTGAVSRAARRRAHEALVLGRSYGCSRRGLRSPAPRSRSRRARPNAKPDAKPQQSIVEVEGRKLRAEAGDGRHGALWSGEDGVLQILDHREKSILRIDRATARAGARSARRHPRADRRAAGGAARDGRTLDRRRAAGARRAAEHRQERAGGRRRVPAARCAAGRRAARGDLRGAALRARRDAGGAGARARARRVRGRGGRPAAELARRGGARRARARASR